MSQKNIIFRFYRFFSKKRFWFFFTLFFTLLWFFFISPFLLTIPDDFHYQADMISVDNFYDEKLGEFRGEQYSNTKFLYEVMSKDGPVLNIKNTFHVATSEGKTIFKSEPLYGIDSFSGKHVTGFGDRDRYGYLFAPRGLQKNEKFTYWHASNNKSVVMRYFDERFLYGLRVFKYESEYQGPLDQTEFMHHLAGVPEERGIKLGNSITMWLEPISGYVVKMEERSEEYFYFDIKTGKTIAPYNQFLNVYTEGSVRDHVKSAISARNKVIAIQIAVPVILFLFFLISVTFYWFPDLFIFSPKYFVPGFVFIGGILITILIFFVSQNNIEKNEKNIFSSQADEITNLIREKMNIYTHVLSGGKGFFDSSSLVERDEWRTYVNALGIDRNYPGIQGLGFSRVVQPHKKNSFISFVKNEGFPDFRITPEGERGIYTSILFLEPFSERNKRAFGYDMFSDSTRRQAMNRALETGLPALSGKVILKQETDVDIQNGFLLYVPVYKNANNSRDIDKKNIFGFVYATFRANDFISSIINTSNYSVSFRIFDNLRILPDAQIYTSPIFPAEDDEIIFRDLKTLTIAGHPWTIEFVNSPKFQRNAIYSRLSSGILLLGFFISSLLFFMIYLLMTSRDRAIDYANKINKKLIKNFKDLKVTQDTTVQALSDLSIQKDKLKKTNTRLKLATQGAKIGIWEWDIAKDNLIWDTQMYALYGYKKTDFSGKAYDAWHASIHPEDREKVDIAMKYSLRSKQGFNMKFRVIWPDNSLHDIHASGLVITDAHDTPIHMFGVNWDITHEALVDRQKTEFVSIVSHQLRTPLTAMSWYTEMIMGEKIPKLSTTQKKYLKEIYQSNQVMVDLVNKLLNITRIELGTLKIESKEVDIAALIEDVISQQQKNIQFKKLSIETYFDATPVYMTDPTLLRIILQNLLANAIKYTPKSGKIMLRLQFQKNNFLFKITDTGCGIPYSAQKQIFQKFFRAENARETQGTGLGLYIVKSFVEKLRGSISFESLSSDEKNPKKSSGTAFVISLPFEHKKSS